MANSDSGSMADNVDQLATLTAELAALRAQFDTFTNGAVNETYTTTDGRLVQSLSSLQQVLLTKGNLLDGSNINGGGAARDLEFQFLRINGGKA